MQKRTKKLTLTRETLAHLQNRQLLPVAGGGSKGCNPSAFTDCQTEPTSNLGTCGSCYACTNPT